LDDIAEVLLRALRTYPQYNLRYLYALLRNLKTRKIAISLIGGKVENLSAEDFETVTKSGNFLFSCSQFILMYGTDYAKEDFLNLAIGLLNRAREYLERGTCDYAVTLGDEGIARRVLAEFGIDPTLNLELAIELCGRARREGFIKNTQSYALALMNEGVARVILASLGAGGSVNLDKGKSVCIQAKKFFVSTGDRMNTYKANRNLAGLKYFSNEMSEAYSDLKEAIELIEGMREEMEMPKWRKEFFETVVEVYKLMVFVCLAIQKYEEAFKCAESAKGRTLLEFLASKKRGIRIDPELMKQYRSILRRIEKIELKHAFSSRKKRKVALVELQRLRSLHDDLLMKMRGSDIGTVDLIDLGKLPRILKGKTLVEYFLGRKLAIFVVNDSLIVETVNVDEDEVAKKVSKLRRLIDEIGHRLLKRQQVADKKYEIAEEILKDFHKLLIQPIEGLDLNKEIVMVPHSYLHLVPFQALKSEKYLVEDYTLHFAPNASSLQFLGKGKGKGALIVGNPTGDLNFAEDEALDVARLFNIKPILRQKAKRKLILRRIEGKKVLHFACHGLFDPFVPAFSRIVLANDDLTAIDFMNLEIDANVTVLSACETAIPEIKGGDEVEGLVRAIQYGGSRFVVASLWKVLDKSTKELFLKFYAEEGDVGERLRKAILSLKDSGYGFYHWAPFQAYGV